MKNSHPMRCEFLAGLLGAIAMLPAAVSGADFDPATALSPGVVALYERSPGHWGYRQFPTLISLYIRDRDVPGGKSTCNADDGCSGAWPPLYATDKDTPIGEWTLVERQFNRKQWAYKGKPVYLRYHDMPELTEQDGFRLLVP